jgi:hypothetical protein
MPLDDPKSYDALIDFLADLIVEDMALESRVPQERVGTTKDFEPWSQACTTKAASQLRADRVRPEA